ncbi:MAG: 16S rRNA (adenine(1518)-N(6)/adenine(1519)-N(6))-dimethyltransferase RsmA [Candidatus Longimicrobiales bacterium M2_2A_002]
MRARRSLGQNFLVDPNLQRKIVDAVEPGPDDTVIEIGPGQGALTDRLAGAAGRLVAVELDDRLAEDLARRFDDDPSVSIIHADFLEWEPGDLATRETRVVGNIPYNITSPLLFRLLEWRPAPERIVVMVQREVADRILAEPGEKAYGALTVGVRAVADVERLFHVGRAAFRPVPGVDSTVLEIRPRGEQPDEADFDRAAGRLRALTRAAFGLRRKQLQKILRIAPGYGLDPEAAEAVLAEVGVEPAARPETLDPDTFVALADALARRGYPSGEPGS